MKSNLERKAQREGGREARGVAVEDMPQRLLPAPVRSLES